MEEKGLLRVNLDIRNCNDVTILSSSIANIGKGKIALGNTFLFIDQGIFDDKRHCYEFPFIQKKFLKMKGIADEDCIAAAQCKMGKPVYPIFCPHIEHFYNGTNSFYNCYTLPHLSSQSILYMAPDEVFTEELVLKFNKGVYRALLVCVPNPESCDCICCNRNFYIY